MKKVETQLPVGRIIQIKELSDGSYKVVQEVVEEVAEKVVEEVVCEPKVLSGNNIILIEAERLSAEDCFMCYIPKTNREKEMKELILEVIENKVKNFYRPIMDPSFTDDGISYVVGKNPAGCRSYNWWADTAKKYDPSRESRLGTRLEYGAFLGVLIKKLVEEGKSIEWAWNAVCNDSKELGHYWNSEDAKHKVEPTGSRCICGFYDLVNVSKILAEDEEVGGFWLAGGDCNSCSFVYPLVDLCCGSARSHDFNFSVGWLVLS